MEEKGCSMAIYGIGVELQHLNFETKYKNETKSNFFFSYNQSFERMEVKFGPIKISRTNIKQKIVFGTCWIIVNL